MRKRTRWILRASVAGAAVLAASLAPIDFLVSFAQPTTSEIVAATLLLHGSSVLLVAGVWVHRRRPARSG
jgi:uncharacterized membrane protein